MDRDTSRFVCRRHKGLGCRAPSITVLTWEVSYRYVHIILSCCCCRLFSCRLLEVCSSSVQTLYTGVVFSIFLTEQHSEAFQVSAELAHGFHPSSKKICKDCFCVFATRFQTRNCFQIMCMRCVVFFVWIR
ncbi:unnamed protein product [Sphagnum troendelagicum]|uniref:Uncharacterized protein n=1 Tax=Sphagnum troendelagicum TaxID=128251 RepID=A0ABP0UEX3_9BRYO